MGGEGIWLALSTLGHRARKTAPITNVANAEDSQGYLKFVALVILIPYFLFTSGFIYEVTGQELPNKVDTPYSIALSSYRLDLAGVFYWQDGAAAGWLAQKASDETVVHYDNGRPLLIHEVPGHLIGLQQDASEFPEDGYVYFSARNISKRELTFAINPGVIRSISFDDFPGLTAAIEGKKRIYNNGGAQILR